MTDMRRKNRFFLTGAILGGMLLPLFSNCFVFLKIYSKFGIAESACHALAVFSGIAVHLLLAAVIVRLVMPEGRKTAPKIVIDVLLLIYGAVMLVMALAFGGFDGVFFGFIYDGFHYAETLRLKECCEYFRLRFIEILYDLRFLFYWIAALSVMQTCCRPDKREFTRLCGGGILSAAVVIVACLLVGHTKYWQIVDWYDMPQSAEQTMCGIFFAGVLASGVWLLAAHIKASKAAKKD